MNQRLVIFVCYPYKCIVQLFYTDCSHLSLPNYIKLCFGCKIIITSLIFWFVVFCSAGSGWETEGCLQKYREGSCQLNFTVPRITLKYKLPAQLPIFSINKRTSAHFFHWLIPCTLSFSGPSVCYHFKPFVHIYIHTCIHICICCGLNLSFRFNVFWTGFNVICHCSRLW